MVEDIDRLGRDYDEILKTVSQLKEKWDYLSQVFLC